MKNEQPERTSDCPCVVRGLICGRTAVHAATRVDAAERVARAGVVRISQSAVTVKPRDAAREMKPGQYSGGIRFRAAHARTLTGRVSKALASATRAAPPNSAMRLA